MKISRIFAILILLSITGSLATGSSTQNSNNENNQQQEEEEDLSGIIEQYSVYSGQTQSPVEITPTLQEMEEGITEYGFSFWFKLDYLWNDDEMFYFGFQKKLSLCHIYESDQNIEAISIYLQQETYNYQTLKIQYYQNYFNGHSFYIRSYNLDQLNFDGQWVFLYGSYSKTQQNIDVGLFLPQQNMELYSIQIINVGHRELSKTNRPTFRLGNPQNNDYEGFNGQFRDVKFQYGAEGSGIYKNPDDLANSFPDLKNNGYKVNPISKTVSLSLSQDEDQNQIDRLEVVDQDIIVKVNNVQYVNNYAVEGYFKVSSEDTLDNEYRLVYKVSTKNYAHPGNFANMGEITLQAEINANGLKFTTYDIYSYNHIGKDTTTFSLTTDQYYNFIYIYQGYIAQEKSIITYIKTYDSATGEFVQFGSYNIIFHMKSNDYVISLAKDQHHSQRLRSVFSCFNFRTEDNAGYAQSESEIQELENQSCRQDGFIPNLELDYKLKSYSDDSRFLSYGNPTFLTDDRIGRFQIVKGLIGDANTVSLKSIQTINGQIRDQFYWRHDGNHIREMQYDETNKFKKQASFITHQDLFFPGTIALESVNKRGYYITVQNYAIVLLKDDQSELMRQKASWILEEYPQQQLPELQLLPIWRLYKSEIEDTVLTTSDEKVQALQQEGYELEPLTMGSSFVQVKENSNNQAIFGYGYNQVRDSHSSALLEFVDPDTNTHFYSTDPNGYPYQINSVVAYVYSVNYERTVPAYKFNWHDSESGLSYLTTSEQEYQELLQYNDLEYNGKAFWVVTSDNDPCLNDINQCGPAIPDPCVYNYQYREVQESECIECDGFINHYEGDVISLKYTAVCEWCIGGWNQDSEGVRTCKTCDGYWADVGDTYQLCYPHCNIADNYYVNPNTILCVQCPGELIPDPDNQHLHTCKTCEMGTDIELTCESQDEVQRIIYEPETCAENESQVGKRQVCKYCEFGEWTRNSDNGQLYCIKVCNNPNDYVDEQNECKPCDFGNIYDDGTGTKRCAQHVKVGPLTTSQTTENAYSYSVPSDQLDDISELGFFFWFKGSYLTPNFINTHLFRTENARIGGFHFGTKTEIKEELIKVGVREYWENMYKRDQLLHYFPFVNDLQDKITGNAMEKNGAYISSQRDGSRRPGTLYVWNDSPSITSGQLYGRDEWTVAFWVKIWSGRDDDQSLFSAYQNGNLKLSLNTQSIWYDGSNSFISNYLVGNTDTWHHVVYGRYSTYIDFYVNGQYQNDGHYSSSSRIYANEFKLGIGDKNQCDAWISDLTIFSTGDNDIDNKLFINDNEWFRSGGEDIFENQTYEIHTPKILETQFNNHISEHQDHEILKLYGNGEGQMLMYPERKDFDNSWNLLYVSQNFDGQAVGYTYFSHSEEARMIEFEAQSDISEINFYLGQFNGYENIGQCFQGQFYNVELRFGNTGVFHTTTDDIQAYLHQQNSGINQLPPIIHYTNLFPIFEQNTIIDLSQLSNEEKTFTFDNLEATQEYAVFGWFKEHDDFELIKDRALFNLKDLGSSSDDTQWNTNPKVGDRAILVQYSSDYNMEFETYSHSPSMGGLTNDAINNAKIPYLKQDLKQWFFVYASFSSQQNRVLIYVKELVHGNEYSSGLYEQWHMRPDKQVLNVGYYPSEDLPSYQYTSFKGDVYNLRVQYGTVCQPPDYYSCLKTKFGNVPTPDPKGQCVILYNKPNFQGEFVAVCDKNPDFTMTIQSIYIPQGVSFRLYDSIHFQGLSVLYTKSFESISSIDFELLLLDQVSGAEIIKNDKYYKYIQKQQKSDNKNFLAVNLENDENSSINEDSSQEQNQLQEEQDNQPDNFNIEEEDQVPENIDQTNNTSSNDEKQNIRSQKKDHLRANAFKKRT